MPKTLFNVVALLNVYQIRQVEAEDSESAASLVRTAGPDFFKTQPYEFRSLIGIGQVSPVPLNEPPEYSDLKTRGTLFASQIGRQVYRYADRIYQANWMTGPGTPCWCVSEVISDDEQ